MTPPDLVIHHHRHQRDTLIALRGTLGVLADSCAGDTGWIAVARRISANVTGPMHTTSFRHASGRVVEVGRIDGDPHVSLAIDAGNGSGAIAWTISVPQATDADPATHVAIAHAIAVLRATPDLRIGEDHHAELAHWGRGVVAHLEGIVPHAPRYLQPPCLLRRHPAAQDGDLQAHDGEVKRIRHPEIARIASVSPTIVSVHARERVVTVRSVQYSHDEQAAAADPMGTLRALADLRHRLDDAA